MSSNSEKDLEIDRMRKRNRKLEEEIKAMQE